MSPLSTTACACWMKDCRCRCGCSGKFMACCSPRAGAATSPQGISDAARTGSVAPGRAAAYTLRVQVIAVGEDRKGEVAAQLAMHLAGEEHHGTALARALGMPEHPQLAAPMLAVADRLDGPVDAQELVVAGRNLPRFPGRIDDHVQVVVIRGFLLKFGNSEFLHYLRFNQLAFGENVLDMLVDG